MKKIILIIICFTPLCTFAETKYINQESIVSEEKLEESDTLVFDYEEKVYNTYNEEYVKDQYKELDKCINCDFNDYIIKYEYTNAETTDLIKYVPTTSYTYNQIRIFSSSNTVIYEFEIYADGVKIDYTSNLSDLINDSNLETGAEVIKKQEINIFINDVRADVLEIRVYSKEMLTGSTYFFYKEFETSNNIVSSFTYLSGFGALALNKIAYEEYSKKLDLSKPIYLTKKEYYQDYLLNRVILNEYVSTGSNLIYDDYKTLYHYKKYERVDLDEEEKNTSYDQFILNESSEEIENNSSTDTSIINNKVITKTKKIETTTSKIIDDEIVEVEPLMQKLDDTIVNKKDKVIVIIIIGCYIILSIVLLVFYIYSFKENN